MKTLFLCLALVVTSVIATAGIHRSANGEVARLDLSLAITSFESHSDGRFELSADGEFDGENVGLRIASRQRWVPDATTPKVKSYVLRANLQPVGERSRVLDQKLSATFGFKEIDSIFRKEGYHARTIARAERLDRDEVRLFLSDYGLEGAADWWVVVTFDAVRKTVRMSFSRGRY